MSTYVTPLPARPSAPSARRRTARVALWVLQIALAAALGAAGASKLAGVPAMVQLFDAIGIGQWLRYVTGTLELLGALLLLVPAVAGSAALLLAVVMTGAALSNVLVLHNSPAAPATLLAGLAVVLYARRAEITAWLARRRA